MSGPVEVRLEQGSREWIEARLGIPTASRFSSLVTGTGKASTGEAPLRLLGQLLAEWQAGEPANEFGGTPAMEIGNALEPRALDWYEFDTGVRPRKTGIVYSSIDRMVGASPDGLVDDSPDGSGGIELKCPSPHTHALYLLSESEGLIPSQYRAQVYGSLWVTRRAWWDFVSYCPGWPEVRVRAYPQDPWMATFDKVMPVFIERMLAARETLRQLGVTFYMDSEREPT